jgi:hypothetical protein
MPQDATSAQESRPLPGMSSGLEQRATLVFPAVNQAAVEYLTAARHRGERTVCAASVTSHEVATECSEVHRLPWIYDAAFPSSVLSLMATHSVGRLFCPVATVHEFMQRFIAAHHLDLEMIGQSPIRQQVEEYHQLMARAGRLLPLVELCADGYPSLSLREVAGVLRQASLIYGESNDDKLAAMMGVAASAPPGDVVEIGTLMGRSASVLLYLAWRYRTGPVLTIDPWRADNATQRQSPDSFRALVDEWDFEVLSEGFFVNMIALRADDHTHLRMTSQDAFAKYANGQALRGPRENPVTYSGKIAIIHIDGNHDYDSVKQDCELWLGRMLPESWLILDDYLWAHGDGPYRVGNELLRDQSERIDCAFVCGKALFVKWRFQVR